VKEIKLTKYSHGSGCGCKIEPAVLEKILMETGEKSHFASLIAGYETKDDAAVWDMDPANQDGNYLLSTTDFFTPIVDDPFDFGRISAANALSDIYAMGGRPAFALAILGFPVNTLSPEIAQRIIAGARNICEKANVPIAGGHSIDIPEPVFGLCVNGFVKKKYLKKNNGGKDGDLLFLTKPLGIGVMSSAMKREMLSEKDYSSVIETMVRLNEIGSKLSMIVGVHAMTDVTGFGLLGHLIEMCEGSGVSATIDYNSIPLIPGVETYTSQFIFPDNTYRNWNAYEKKVSGINGTAFITLCDPQTSGGLLISIEEKSANELIKILNDEGLAEFIKPIGRLTSKNEIVINVLNG
jgi:selenide,water dikinase